MRLTALLLVAALTLPIAAMAQLTDGVVRIGVMTDLSGVYADLAGTGSIWAARRAVEDSGVTNRGIKVEVVVGDHMNKADVGSGLARRWYDEDKVDAIVDVPTSSVALAVNEVTRERNRVFLASMAGLSDLTGKACSPNTVHWTYDTWSLANSTARAVVKSGGKSWFFLTADYAFGHSMERDTEAAITANGGRIAGRVRHPFPGQDFASFLLQAQGSKANVIGLANASSDAVNSIKQASDFGITSGGQKIAALILFITDVHSLGLAAAQGTILTEAWY